MSDEPSTNPAPRKKRIAVFLDGTWNTVNDNTNVWRLKSLLAPSGKDALNQILYYHKGVGTSFGSYVRGGVFGYGLDDEIIRAYEWLIDNYRLDDELFISDSAAGRIPAQPVGPDRKVRPDCDRTPL